ncbi:MAG: hypothetical protein V3R80_12000, partial [Candidatus Tectomicrobia bacterium]
MLEARLAEMQHYGQHGARRGMAPRSQYRLSGLQKSILQWLRSEQRRRHRTDNAMGIAYPELVRALDAGKAPVTTGLRQLMRRALVVVT